MFFLKIKEMMANKAKTRIQSDKYISEYKILHQEKDSFGASCIKQLNYITLIIDYIKPKKVLDFGCGKGTLIKELSSVYPDIVFDGYDPAVSEFENLPEGEYDLVICTDVLEHIPENNLKNVVKKIKEYSSRVFFQLHHSKASQILPNGENAHVTVKPPLWYEKLFKKYFHYVIILPAKRPWLSTCFTFSVDDEFLNKYDCMLKEGSNDTI